MASVKELLVLLLALMGWASAPPTASSAPKPPPPASLPPKRVLLPQALAGPMKEAQEIVFCTRLRYDDPHWYANIGYYCDDENKKAYAGNGKPDRSKLFKWNIRSGKLSVLCDAQGGSIRDPVVHYDAEKILFSYRKAGTDYYHLYEINTDGSGLRQLTGGEFDDYEPVYLPDGGIAFVSTRCKRWVNCWMTQVGILYRCDADGRNIRPISASTEHDNTPWVLPDGRLLYMRWEYVDRSQVEFHGLWTMNPDGSGVSIYFGNMHPRIVMLDAKPIPGSEKVVASFSPGHGVNEHAGVATIVSPQNGPDDPAQAKPLHKGKMTRDPYAFSEHCVIAARDNELVLMDGSGDTEVIYQHTGEGNLHEPRPILSRPREIRLQPRSHAGTATGYLVLANAYESRNLPGVNPGDIRKLLILESLPKPVNFSGGQDLLSWLGTFTLERVLGTVPVEKDGSAYFEVPADRQLLFVALDEHDLSIKRMQSFANVVPGETLSCVGCHEHRSKAPENRSHGALMALRRPPSKIEPFDGQPDVLDFARDIQPILDRYCVKCHTYENRKGGLILSGDMGKDFSHAYFSLLAHRLVADGRNGLGNQPPRTIGSSASPLLERLERQKVSAQEWRTVWLWIESGAPFAGTYAALRNADDQRRAGEAFGRIFSQGAPVLQRRCYTCHKPGQEQPEHPLAMPVSQHARRTMRDKMVSPTGQWERLIFERDPITRLGDGILVNFTRPHLSPLLLGPLAQSAGGYGSCGEVFSNTNDPDYQLLLSLIQEGKTQLESSPLFPLPGFKPNPQYVRELKKYGVLPPAFELATDPMDIYAADQQYWRSLWTIK